MNKIPDEIEIGQMAVDRAMRDARKLESVKMYKLAETIFRSEFSGRRSINDACLFVTAFLYFIGKCVGRIDNAKK